MLLKHQRVLDEFPRRASRYFGSNQQPADQLEWLSWMQHFGAPTQLLDFTYSPYVAVYFAFEEKDRGMRLPETEDDDAKK